MRLEISGLSVSEAAEPSSNAEWAPEAPEKMRPILVWPPQPVALVKWIFSYPGFLVPRNFGFLALALVVWFWMTPALEHCRDFQFGWVAAVYLRDLLLIGVVYSFYHVLLYVVKTEGTRGKYNPKWPARKSRKFLFDDQVWDNVFWSLAVGPVIVAAFDVVTLWFYANGHIPMLTWQEHPAWFVLLFLLLPFWREFHFYWIHRLIHWKPLYRRVHYLHHLNHNPNAWSGLAMHPVETVIYFSAVTLHWFVPSHPIHFIFLLQMVALLPAITHHGFHGPILKGKLPTGSYFHYLHHKYYECNYGGTLLPFDQWFGTFRNSSK